ncbi:MAG: transglutaminase-like domain-containing protein, partial [Promethearchaeota archaeon]
MNGNIQKELKFFIIMGNIDIYLQPTEFFDFNKKFVREKAFEITAGLETESDKAKALFYWVRDKIKYNMHTYIPSAKA